MLLLLPDSLVMPSCPSLVLCSVGALYLLLVLTPLSRKSSVFSPVVDTEDCLHRPQIFSSRNLVGEIGNHKNYTCQTPLQLGSGSEISSFKQVHACEIWQADGKRRHHSAVVAAGKQGLRSNFNRHLMF